jgi:hypothetical protein
MILATLGGLVGLRSDRELRLYPRAPRVGSPQP